MPLLIVNVHRARRLRKDGRATGMLHCYGTWLGSIGGANFGMPERACGENNKEIFRRCWEVDGAARWIPHHEPLATNHESRLLMLRVHPAQSLYQNTHHEQGKLRLSAYELAKTALVERHQQALGLGDRRRTPRP